MASRGRNSSSRDSVCWWAEAETGLFRSLRCTERSSAVEEEEDGDDDDDDDNVPEAGTMLVLVDAGDEGGILLVGVDEAREAVGVVDAVESGEEPACL